MTIKAGILVVLIALAPGFPTQGQGAFLNLDFEMADMTHVGFTNAFPHWHGIAGGIGGGELDPFPGYNDVLLDSAQIGIWDQRGRDMPLPLFGEFSVFLAADAGPTLSMDAELFQTGLVPAGTKSIHFFTTAYTLLGERELRQDYWQLRLLLNGQNVPYTRVESQPEFIQWAADVSGYAGQEVELRFLLHTAYPPNSPPPYDVGVAIGLDNIAFSPVAIPEPASTGLVALGTAVLLWRRRKTSRM